MNIEMASFEAGKAGVPHGLRGRSNSLPPASNGASVVTGVREWSQYCQWPICDAAAKRPPHNSTVETQKGLAVLYDHEPPPLIEPELFVSTR